MPNFSSIGQEMAEILRIQRTCGGWWVGGGGGGWWIPSKNLVTSDRLVRVSRSRSESVTIKANPDSLAIIIHYILLLDL